jgi:hypothetical protein
MMGMMHQGMMNKTQEMCPMMGMMHQGMMNKTKGMNSMR